MFHLEFRYLWRLHWTTWVFVRWKGGFLRLRRINRRFFLLQCVDELCIFHNVKHAWNAKWHRHNIRNVLLILRTWLTIDLMTFSDTHYLCAPNDSIFFVFFFLFRWCCVGVFMHSMCTLYIVHCYNGLLERFFVVSTFRFRCVWLIICGNSRLFPTWLLTRLEWNI